MSNKVIINADDFGFDVSTSTAIAHCFNKGLINSTSMMVNYESFDHSLELADKYGFRGDIGLHTNLTEGTSVTDLRKTGLTDRNGVFVKNALLNPSLLFSRTLKTGLINEMRAQFQKLVANGIEPTHIDSHHHIHTLPWLSPLFIQLAKEKHLRIRVANTRRHNFILRLYNIALNRYLRKNDLHFSDRFETIQSFIKYSAKSKSGHTVYEIMVHPAYRNEVVVDVVDRVNLETSLNLLSSITAIETTDNYRETRRKAIKAIMPFVTTIEMLRPNDW